MIDNSEKYDRIYITHNRICVYLRLTKKLKPAADECE